MEWFEVVINAVLFATIIGGLIFERKWTKQLNKRLDLHKTHIDAANRAATDAKVNSLDAKRDARQAKNLVNERQVIVPTLPDTPHNESVAEALRAAAKKAHPAGTGRVPGIRRSALTGRYRAPSSYTPAPDNTTLGVAAVIASTAWTTDSNSGYSDSSSSSSSSYDSGSSSSSDSGSFGGGDSGSF